MKEVTLFKEDSYKNQKQMEKKKVVEQYSMREQEERKKERSSLHTRDII